MPPKIPSSRGKNQLQRINTPTALVPALRTSSPPFVMGLCGLQASQFERLGLPPFEHEKVNPFAHSSLRSMSLG